MLSGMSSLNPEPGDFTSVVLQCVGLPVSEAGLNRMSDLLAYCGVSVAVTEHAQGIGVSYTSEAFAFTCLIPALGDKYCPVQSGFDDAHFTGLSAAQASVLWLMAQRFSYHLLPGPTPVQKALMLHIAQGGTAKSMPGKAHSTVRQQLGQLREKYGVATNAALIAMALKLGHLQ